jgi:hypothetical protein
MREFPIERIQEFLRSPQGRLVLVALGGLLALLIVREVVRTGLRLFRHTRRSLAEDAAPDFDVAALAVPDRDWKGARLTVYHVPVRVGLVVVAPLARDTDLPDEADVTSLLDKIVPGLGEVADSEDALRVIWPRQYSASGFAHRLARHVKLPGEMGRDTPWCLVAGRASVRGEVFVVGLALAAATPNNLTLIVIESDHQWLDVLRVRPTG